ncbi:MAG: hypothetical protein ACYS5V_06205, partial [Planctomycetota bacterium]
MPSRGGAGQKPLDRSGASRYKKRFDRGRRDGGRTGPRAPEMAKTDPNDNPHDLEALRARIDELDRRI